MGTGTHGFSHRSYQTELLGIQGLARLLNTAYDEGINFWDSADQYGTHPHLKEALKYVPREKVTILTKTHATTEDEMKKDLDRFREEIGTDYLDIVLLHFQTKDNWPGYASTALCPELGSAFQRRLPRFGRSIPCFYPNRLKPYSFPPMSLSKNQLYWRLMENLHPPSRS